MLHLRKEGLPPHEPQLLDVRPLQQPVLQRRRLPWFGWPCRQLPGLRREPSPGEVLIMPRTEEQLLARLERLAAAYRRTMADLVTVREQARRKK